MTFCADVVILREQMCLILLLVSANHSNVVACLPSHQVIELGTMSQSKETVSFIIQHLHQALLDRMAKAEVLKRPPSEIGGSIVRNNSTAAGSRSRHRPQPSLDSMLFASVEGYKSSPGIDGVGAGLALPTIPLRNIGRPASPPYGEAASVLLQSTDGGGVASVIATGVMKFAWLISKSWVLVMALVFAMQLFLLLRLGNGVGIGGVGQQPGVRFWSHDQEYWIQRLVVLHQELQLLRSRTEAVTREVSAVLQVLCHQAGEGTVDCPSTTA